MKTILSWLCALLFFSYGVGAQSLSYTKADSLFCLQVLDSLKHLQTPDAGERMVQVAATLEGEPETLVVNFRELDCTTLVESVLALSQPVSSFADYTEALRGLRYRKGEVRYTERLHYIADWMYENGKRGSFRILSSFERASRAGGAYAGSRIGCQCAFWLCLSAERTDGRGREIHPQWRHYRFRDDD